MLAALNVVTLETLPLIVSVNRKVADPYTERGFRCFLRALLVDLVRPRQEIGHVIGVGVARHDAVRHAAPSSCSAGMTCARQSGERANAG